MVNPLFPKLGGMTGTRSFGYFIRRAVLLCKEIGKLRVPERGEG